MIDHADDFSTPVADDHATADSFSDPVFQPTAEVSHAPGIGNNFRNLYQGLDTLDLHLSPDEKRGFAQLDSVSDNSKAARAQAINQAYLRSITQDMPPSYLERNWESVREAVGNKIGLPGRGITDVQLYGAIAKQFQDDEKSNAGGETELKAWTFKDRLGSTAFETMHALGKFWNSINQSPLREIPEAPPDLPDLPALGMNNPAIAGGVWNGLRPLLLEGTSPFGISTLGVGAQLHASAKAYPLAKVALVGMNGLFAGLMGWGAAEGAIAAPKVLNDPNATTQEKVAAVTKPVAEGAMALLATVDAALNALPGLKQKAVLAELEGKTPAEAADVLRAEAIETPAPPQADAIFKAADALESLQPKVPEVTYPKHQEAVHDGGFHGVDDLPALPREVGEIFPELVLGEKPVATKTSAPAETGLVGIKNESVDAEMERMGLPAATHGEKTTFAGEMAKAKTILENDPKAAERLIEQVKAEARPLTSTEDALLLQEMNKRRLERDAANKALDEATKSGEPSAVQDATIRAQASAEAFHEAAQVATQAGTKNAQALALRRMMLREDYSLAGMESKLQRAKGGGKLTPEESAKVKELSERVEKTGAEAEAYAKQGRTNPDAPRRKPPQRGVRDFLSDQAAAARQRLKDRLSGARVSSTIGVDVLADLAIVGADHLAKGVTGLAEWSKKMTEEFGEKITEHLGDIWKKAKDHYENAEVHRALEARKASLTRRIAELEKRLADGGYTPEQLKANRPAIAEIEALAQKRDALSEKLAEARKEASKPSEQDAIKDQVEAIEQQIAVKKTMIESGQIEPKTNRELNRPAVKEVEIAKQRLEEVNADLAELRKGPPKSKTESALEAKKLRLTKSTQELQKRTREQNFEKPTRQEVKLDEEGLRLQAENNRAKEDFQRLVKQRELASESPAQKVAQSFGRWRRGFLLSSPATLAKLSAAAIWRMGFTPIEEGVGGVLSKIPVLSRVSEMAPREGGFSANAEVNAITEAVTTGMRDAWDMLRTGKSRLDLGPGHTLGKISLADVMPRSAIDFFGNLHGALKSPVKRSEFARSFAKRMEFYSEKGLDPKDPELQTRVAVEAYKDANRAIFMQDNMVVDAYKRALSRFKQVDKKTGQPSAGGLIAATALETALPIVKIPINIVGEIFTYAGGTVSGSTKLTVTAMTKGIDKLTPEEADMILRHLKKGLVGSALMLYGYLNSEQFGGYYQHGEKRAPDEAKLKGVKLGDHDVPSTLLHNPAVEQLQIGASLARISDSKLNKKDAEDQGLTAAALATALGVAEEVPFAREAVQVGKLFDPHERQYAAGELLKSIFVPAIVDWTARHMDTDEFGEPVKRKPKTALEHVESGIPGLREELPTAKK